MKSHGVRVNSRAELEDYLRKNPLRLRAARLSLPPRPGHPDFMGPALPGAMNRMGAITFDRDGGASFTIHKEPWERERDEKFLRLLGEI